MNGIDSLVPFTRPTTAFVPVNQLSDSLNWTRGNHTFQFGTDLFLIRNNHISYLNSFSDVQTNVVYLNTGGIANDNSPLDPGSTMVFRRWITTSVRTTTTRLRSQWVFLPKGTAFIITRATAAPFPGPSDQPPLRHQ